MVLIRVAEGAQQEQKCPRGLCAHVGVQARCHSADALYLGRKGHGLELSQRVVAVARAEVAQHAPARGEPVNSKTTTTRSIEVMSWPCEFDHRRTDPAAAKRANVGFAVPA